MIRKLTVEDRNKLKYKTRIGYVFGSFILVPVIGLFITSELGIIPSVSNYLLPAAAVMALFITWAVNRRYWNDLKNSKKKIVIRSVDRKEANKHYEAGSSVGFSTTGKKSAFYNDMASHVEYSFIIDNTRYRVDKEVWDSLNEKEEVEFHIALRSKELLDIKPKK